MALTTGRRHNSIKRSAFSALLATMVMAACGHSAEERVAALIDAADYFELARQMDSAAADSLPEVLRLTAKGMLCHYFNRPDEACRTLYELTGRHSRELGESRANEMRYLLGQNLARSGRYAEAAATLRRLVDGMGDAPSDNAARAVLLSAIGRYEAYARLDGVCKTLHEPDDYRSTFFIDHSMYGGGEGGMIAVNAMFGDQRQHVVLDTGAGVNVISSRDAARLGLRMTDMEIVMNGVGTVFGRMAVADTLRIGRMAWANVPFYIVDMSEDGAGTDNGGTAEEHLSRVSLPPIIGQPLLNSMGEVQLDFANRALIVPRKQTRNPARHPNMMLNDSGIPVLEAHDGDGGRLLALFDTGSYECSLCPQWYARNKAFTEANGSPDSLQYSGMGGRVAQRSYRLPSFSVRIGSAVRQTENIQVGTGLDLHSGEAVDDRGYLASGTDMVIGVELIRRFSKVTINMREMFVTAE